MRSNPAACSKVRDVQVFRYLDRWCDPLIPAVDHGMQVSASHGSPGWRTKSHPTAETRPWRCSGGRSPTRRIAAEVFARRGRETATRFLRASCEHGYFDILPSSTSASGTRCKTRGVVGKPIRNDQLAVVKQSAAAINTLARSLSRSFSFGLSKGSRRRPITFQDHRDRGGTLRCSTFASDPRRG